MGVTGIITQARMTSTRLPGKILKLAGGKPLLDYHVQRLQQSGLPLYIATTVNETDDAVSEYARGNNLQLYRGSEDHVLSRFFETAKENEIQTIIRVTSDCPLIDPSLIVKGLEIFQNENNPYAYVSNVIERTYARGFDFEIFSFQYLEEAMQCASDPIDTEHVTPYIWKNKSGKTAFRHIKQQHDNSRFRLTVDTPEDFELIRILIENHSAHTLKQDEIENILAANPKLVAINASIEQKKA
ncbi:MAG TPA: glycosyltransferase family protein [Flavobacteriales bacterium]|nr:glycosyltransferase family protein [Flavobacteriales bacterium]